MLTAPLPESGRDRGPGSAPTSVPSTEGPEEGALSYKSCRGAALTNFSAVPWFAWTYDGWKVGWSDGSLGKSSDGMGRVRDCRDSARGNEVTTPKGENDSGVKGSGLMIMGFGVGVLSAVLEGERRSSGGGIVSCTECSDHQLRSVLTREDVSVKVVWRKIFVRALLHHAHFAVSEVVLELYTNL